MTAPIDYIAVLADLEAKRGQIDAAIEVIRTLIGSGATPESATQGLAISSDDDGNVSTVRRVATPSAPPSGVIQNDTFFGLSTSAAVKKFLGMMKRPQFPRTIADALVTGGQLHAVDDKTAYANVSTALNRGKDTDFSLQKRTRLWGLAEWYPNQPKQAESPKAKKKPKKKAAAKKPTKTPTTVKNPPIVAGVTGKAASA